MPTENRSLSSVRLLLTFAAFAPLFLLWGLRGVDGLPSVTAWSITVGASLWFPGLMAALIIFPYALLYLRFRWARAEADDPELIPAEKREPRDHTVVYLLAMLLPLYDANIAWVRDFLAVSAAVVFVMVVFYKFDLYYTNILLPVIGLRVYLIDRQGSDGSLEEVILISRDRDIEIGASRFPLRLGDRLFLEWER